MSSHVGAPVARTRSMVVYYEVMDAAEFIIRVLIVTTMVKEQYIEMMFCYPFESRTTIEARRQAALEKGLPSAATYVAR